MSNSPYGPSNGDMPPDDDQWFRPVPATPREEIYRESEYGPSAAYGQQPAPSYDQDPFDQPVSSYEQSPFGSQPAASSGQQDPFGQDLYAPQPPPVANGVNALQSLGRPMDAPGDSTRFDDNPVPAYGPPGSYEYPDGPGGPAGPGQYGPGGGDFGGPEDPDDPDVIGRRKKPKKTGWKRYIPNWKIVLGVSLLGMLGVTALITVAYLNTDVPSLAQAQKGVEDQGTNVYDIKNGKPNLLFRLGEPRENVKYKDIPEVVRNAVMAAEQRDFMTDPGVSARGLSRAVWKSATGGDVEGGSTITQQVARNYFQGLSQERTLSRKFKEIFVAVKLDQQMSKEDILELYLNTIYYGRQANGIQAASRAYLGKDIQKITKPADAALLATVLNRPDYFHTTGNPAKDPQRAQTEARWNYVLDGMVKKGWLSAEDRAKQKFPETIPLGSYNKDKGQNSYIRDQVLRDLHKSGLTDQQLNTGGYKVSTSIDEKLMRDAYDAVKEASPPKSELKKTDRVGLVAVDPKTGEVPAFYGGNPFKKIQGKGQADAAFFDTAQVGSSFKPYVMAEALKQGYNVKSMIDAAHFRCFKVDGSWIQGVNNRDSCGRQGGYSVQGDGQGGVLSLSDAMAISQNVAYVRLNLLLGPSKVAKMAESLGVPADSIKKDQLGGGLALGISSYPAVYQASSYAAFANGGRAVIPHIVTKVTHVVDDKEVSVKLPWDKPRKKVMEEDAAAQVTAALQAVVRKGTGNPNAVLAGGRPAAGKTGTTEKGVALWFVGYTPQLSAAATFYGENNKPVLGGTQFGGGPAAKIWKAFMDKALEGKPIKEFPVPTYDGIRKMFDTPKPKTTKPTAPVCDPLNPDDPACDKDNGKNKPGCTMTNLNNCDPNKPPQGTENDPPQWWCSMHQDLWETYQSCKKYGNDNNGDGQQQPDANTDTDHDGNPDVTDPDDDNDGIPDAQDKNPLIPDGQNNNNDNGNGNGNGAAREPVSYVVPTTRRTTG